MSPSPPQVSVLLPFRNAEETLALALRSTLEQEGVVFELLAIDDRSTDGGQAIAEEVAGRDERLRLLSSPDPGGLVNALEWGRANARAPFLARMDADDLALPGRLAQQVAHLESNRDVAALGTRVTLFPEENIEEGMRRYVDWQNSLLAPHDHRRDLFVESPLCHPSVMLRASAMEEIGGYRETGGPEDYDLFLRLDAAGWKLAKLPEHLLRWRHQAGRATFSDPRYHRDRFRDARAEFLAPKLAVDGPLRRGRELAIWGAGPTGKRLARALEGHGISADLFIDIDPLKIGRQARGKPVVGAASLRSAKHFTLVAVAARGARHLVRGALLDRGFGELKDFLCAS